MKNKMREGSDEKEMFKKKLGVGLLALSLSLSIIGCEPEKDPTREIETIIEDESTQEESVAEVEEEVGIKTIQELFDHEHNYLDEFVITSGKARIIVKTEDGVSIILKEGTDDKYVKVVFVDPIELEKVEEVKEGDYLTVQGISAGIIKDHILLEDGMLLEK